MRIVNQYNIPNEIKNRIGRLQSAVLNQTEVDFEDLSLLSLLDDIDTVYGDGVADDANLVIFRSTGLGYDMSGEFVIPLDEELYNEHNDALNTVMYYSALLTYIGTNYPNPRY